jgi:hypothetical protein
MLKLLPASLAYFRSIKGNAGKLISKIYIPGSTIGAEYG